MGNVNSSLEYLHVSRYLHLAKIHVNQFTGLKEIDAYMYLSYREIKTRQLCYFEIF